MPADPVRGGILTAIVLDGGVEYVQNWLRGAGKNKRLNGLQFILVMTGRNSMKEEGYFARQGINIEFEKFPGVSSTLFPLINGAVAVSGGAITPSLISAITKGPHARIVAGKGRNSSLNSCNASGLMVRRDLLNQSCWYPVAGDGNIPWEPVGEYIDGSYANKNIPQKLTEDQLYNMSCVNYTNGVLQNTTSSG